LLSQEDFTYLAVVFVEDLDHAVADPAHNELLVLRVVLTTLVGSVPDTLYATCQ